MVFFKAQKLQRLADLLQRVQGEIEEEGDDLSTAEEELNEIAGTAGLDLEVAGEGGAREVSVGPCVLLFHVDRSTAVRMHLLERSPGGG